IGCIFEMRQVRTEAEGARTRAALFASKDGVALKISQDGEMSIFRWQEQGNRLLVNLVIMGCRQNDYRLAQIGRMVRWVGRVLKMDYEERCYVVK
ncbi:MAG TPA: hypothetical protein VFS77_02040, partial [Pyrinomonadaceae bacterium]|nr:hypothetical protein [Pyrinomonadaceae bacterium]